MDVDAVIAVLGDRFAPAEGRRVRGREWSPSATFRSGVKPRSHMFAGLLISRAISWLPAIISGLCSAAIWPGRLEATVRKPSADRPQRN
jgi:hypothetical protein